MVEGEELVQDWVSNASLALGFDSQTTSWLLAGAIFIAVVFTLVIARYFLLSRLQGVVDKTTNVVDDLLLDLVRRTSWPFFIVLGIFFAAVALKLSPRATIAVRNLFSIALFVQGGVWANYVLSFAVDSYLRRRRGDDSSKLAVLALFNFFARIAVWTLVVLLALDNLGVEVATLIAGLGVGGIAIGLALQSVLKDTFASLSIILDKPFEVGDFIIVDDLQGTVEHIGIKTTRILSLNGEEVVLGNNDLLTSRVRNYKKVQERRVLQSFTVDYDTLTAKLSRIPEIVQEVLASVEEARFDRAYLKSFGEYAIEFEIGYYVTRPDFEHMIDRRHQVNLELHHRFQEEGIRFGVPARRLLVEGEGRSQPKLSSL